MHDDLNKRICWSTIASIVLRRDTCCLSFYKFLYLMRNQADIPRWLYLTNLALNPVFNEPALIFICFNLEWSNHTMHKAEHHTGTKKGYTYLPSCIYINAFLAKMHWQKKKEFLYQTAFWAVVNPFAIQNYTLLLSDCLCFQHSYLFSFFTWSCQISRAWHNAKSCYA